MHETELIVLPFLTKDLWSETHKIFVYDINLDIYFPRDTLALLSKEIEKTSFILQQLSL
jgi:hypothetical protein